MRKKLKKSSDMCLNYCDRLANEEFECYKIVEIVKDENKNIVLRSPYRGYKWELGKEHEPESHESKYKRMEKITRGFFHTFRDYHEAVIEANYLHAALGYDSNFAIIKCLIPKDAITYKGIINDGFDVGYASTKLITQKIIYLSKPKCFEGFKLLKHTSNCWKEFKEIKNHFGLNKKNCRFSRKG